MRAEGRLLEPIAGEMQKRAGEPLWRSLAALDAYRRQFEETPDTITNAVLLGTLLVPLGYDLKPPPIVLDAEGRPKKEPALSLGLLPLARRDVDRLRQILGLQRRLMVPSLTPRARRAVLRPWACSRAL